MAKNTGRDKEFEGDGQGTDNPGSNTSTATTKSSGRGRGRGRSAGSNSKPTEKDLELSNVAAPKVISIEVPGGDDAPKEKKRGRPAGSTSKKKSSKAAPAVIDHSQISLLLLTVSGIMASKPNMQPFALTLDEANQISKPLSAILSKNDGVASIAGEYADHIALLFAVGVIFVPKFLMYQEMKPKKETKQYESRESAGNKKGKTSTSNQPNDRKTTNTNDVPSTSTTFNGQINSILDPLGGF